MDGEYGNELKFEQRAFVPDSMSRAYFLSISGVGARL